MGDDLQEVAQWVGPGGIRVRVVRLVGGHRVWATWAGVPPEVVMTCVITRHGAQRPSRRNPVAGLHAGRGRVVRCWGE